MCWGGSFPESRQQLRWGINRKSQTNNIIAVLGFRTTDSSRQEYSTRSEHCNIDDAAAAAELTSAKHNTWKLESDDQCIITVAAYKHCPLPQHPVVLHVGQWGTCHFSLVRSVESINESMILRPRHAIQVMFIHQVHYQCSNETSRHYTKPYSDRLFHFQLWNIDDCKVIWLKFSK